MSFADVCSRSVASPWVGDTRGGNWGCHPSIFAWKPGDLFLVASSAVSPLFIFSWKNWHLFLCSSLVTSYWFHSRVASPWRVSPPPFLPVRPHFFTILYKFAHKKFLFLGCHPLEGVTRGGPSPSGATACVHCWWLSILRQCLLKIYVDDILCYWSSIALIPKYACLYSVGNLI